MLQTSLFGVCRNLVFRFAMFGTLLSPLLCAAVTPSADFYVSPRGGDDAWSGTRPNPTPDHTDGPFATLGRAQKAVRELRKKRRAGEIRVVLRGGRYVLSDTLKFTAADSGARGAPVVYRAADGEDVWFSGGVSVRPALFKPVTDPRVLALLPEEARGHVLAVNLADAGATDYVKELPDRFSGFTRVEPQFIQVFCNGRQMQWARWPNTGFAKFAEIIDPGSGLRDYKAMLAKKYRPAIFSYTGDRPERWSVKRGVWMMGFWARAYLCTAVRAGKIDTEKKQITWKVPLHYGLDTWGAKRWYAFNLIEELDTPGEWYLDRKKGILYFWPPAPIERCAVMVTRLKEPMLLFDNASYITFRGVGFEGGRGDAVVVKNGENVELIACEVRNIGRHAVQLLGGHGHKVIGCDIHHVGYSGIIMNGGDRKTLEPAGFEAVNNHIHHTNTVKRTHASPVNMRGVGMLLAHNLIHHVPHSAVFYGGNDLVMEYNDVYWCHYETSEGGVFYTGYNWTYRGNVIRYNYIHHINDSLDGSPTGVNVVHLDDCVGGTTFRGNVVYRVGRGVSMCGGPFNVVDNNLFIDCQVGASLSDRGRVWWTWTRQPDGTVTARDTRASHGYSTNNGLLRSLNQVPYDRPPYTKYPHMAELLKVPDEDLGAPLWNVITHNISINGPVVQVSKRIKPHWATIENNWNGPDDGDPGIVAPYAGDYRLKPGAPARKIGFKPVPFEKIGLVNDGTRRTWPVHAEPPPADYKPAWLRRRDMEKRMPGGLPVVAVRRVSAPITVDGTVKPEEWTPGEKRTVGVNRYKPEKLEWDASGGRAKSPSTVYLEVDDDNLYVAFINDVPAKGGIVGGRTWGRSDAVEVALAVASGPEVGPIMIWRGYTDGFFETSGEAGAPKAVVERARRGVAYGADVSSKTRWSAEFKIPFAAIGIDPKKLNPRLLFSLAVRKVSGNQWVTWKSAPGFSWDVRKSGILWLTPFGDITFNGAVRSWARCEIQAAGRNHTPLMDAGKGCSVREWAKPIGCRLAAKSPELGVKWVPFTFTFVPRADGRVRLELRGRPLRSTLQKDRFIPVWTYWDDLRVTGATLVNGDFEQAAAKRAGPAGWIASHQALWVAAPGVAASGKRCVKTWFLGTMSQEITVKKGVPVTVKCQVRGEAAEAVADSADPGRIEKLEPHWFVKADPENTGLKQGWMKPDIDMSGWKPDAVDPRRGNLPAAARIKGRLWCRKELVLTPADRKRRHVWMLFPAVDEEARLYVNGRLAVEHTAAKTGLPPGKLWNTPFAVDVKPFADSAGKVMLALRIATPTPGGGLRKPPLLLATDAPADADILYETAVQQHLLKPRARDYARADIPPVPPAADEAEFGKRIQRTMALLATSTPEHRNRVRILFYGQSIVAGIHVSEIVNTLRRRFPWAVIEAENRAIGGFTAPSLIRTAYHDLYPYCADLVIFHVYGGEKTGQLEDIIRGMREQMTADIMVFTHQIAWNQDPAALEHRTASDDASAEKMRELAAKYDLELVEVRNEWRAYLKANKLPIRELIGDKVHSNVHPNAEGHTLLARLILRHFRFHPDNPNRYASAIRTVVPGDPAITFTGEPWSRKGEGVVGVSRNNALRLTFTGNRVDVLLMPPPAGMKNGTARILIDGKPPAAYPELLRCTRPSAAPFVWWPGLKQVRLGDHPVPEEWRLTLKNVDVDKGTFEFDLEGSKTGPDGHGVRGKPFVSESGRILIEPNDFQVIWALRYRKKSCPENFRITWEVIPLYKDPWRPSPVPFPNVEERDTLVTLLPFGRHTLEIVPEGDGAVPVKAVRIHRPPLAGPPK
ncbi:MAG: hypothetical protein GXP31_11270 [Kiritimatiellaeota bacterium]|nr:hypothetical protein [Kiritimatiellota bacterium]